MTEKPKEDWTLYFTEGDEGPSSWHIRNSFPPELQSTDFPTSVVIEWTYADAGPPNKEVRTQLHAFEELLDSLNDPRENSLLVHIVRGEGVSELCYYCRDYARFMEELNAALRGQPRFPISILHDHDPSWSYCRETKEALECNDG